MNITTKNEQDICQYLDEWRTGRFGKNLTWGIISKAFVFSRQALSGNKRIKAKYDLAKNALKTATTEINILEDIQVEHEQLKSKVAEVEAQNYELLQKYIRWQFNAERMGISILELNTPLPPSYKQAMRERQNEL
jgi:hypothetical protein